MRSSPLFIWAGRQPWLSEDRTRAWNWTLKVEREDPGGFERGEDFGFPESTGGLAVWGGFTLGGLDTLHQLACNHNTETAGQARGTPEPPPILSFLLCTQGLRRVGQDSTPLQSHFCLCLQFYIVRGLLPSCLTSEFAIVSLEAIECGDTHAARSADLDRRDAFRVSSSRVPSTGPFNVHQVPSTPTLKPKACRPHDHSPKTKYPVHASTHQVSRALQVACSQI